MARTSTGVAQERGGGNLLQALLLPTDPKALERRSELIGVIIVALAGAFGAALWTYDAADMDILYGGRGGAGVNNMIGPVGARIADLLLQLFGSFAYGFDGLLALIGLRTLVGKSVVPRLGTFSGVMGAILGTMMLVHLWARAIEIRPHGKDAAGLFGSAATEFLRAFLSGTGTAIVAIVLLCTAASALAGRPLVRELVFTTMRRFGWLRERVGTASEAAGSGLDKWRARREARKEIEESAKFEVAPAPMPEVFRDELPKVGRGDMPDVSRADMPEVFRADMPEVFRADMPEVFREAPAVAVPTSEPTADLPVAALFADDELLEVDFQSPDGLPIPPVPAESPAFRALVDTAPDPAPPPMATGGFPSGTSLRPDDFQVPTAVRNARRGSRAAVPAPSDEVSDADQDDDKTPVLPSRRASQAARLALAPDEQVGNEPGADSGPDDAASGQRATGAARFGPRIVETEAVRSRARPTPPVAEQGRLAIDDKKRWRMPSLDLLQPVPPRGIEIDHDELTENALTLTQKLQDFKVEGHVEDIRPGPVVTTYEFKPAKGVRVNQITKLRDDLTMSLAAENVRVVAPIPGKNVVGIEVPNEHRQIVYFREIVESAMWQNSKAATTLVLGKDIEGDPVIADLAKAPHLLVAGATGMGKSVGVNSFICSMLYKATPDDVKFIFIDPKVIELSIYEGIPHLLLPVISDPDKATLALKWAVREMERRYGLLHDAQVRNIDGYRQKLPKLKLQAKTKKVRVRNGKKELVDMHEPGADLLDHPTAPEHLPKIVIVIDEFADLILNSGKDVETAVSRLAAKARACGIHIILATQRPDVKVITGTIKANFPTRVAFKVATKADSGVVLDQSGADTLLGNGDMLFWPAGKDIMRCHGTYVTDDEVVAIANHWKAQGEPDYDMEILKDPEAEDIAIIADEDLDKVFWEAVKVCIDAQQASVSFIQRKLSVGYNRAARIIDQMEARGIVGPSTGANRPRDIIDFSPPGLPDEGEPYN